MQEINRRNHTWGSLSPVSQRADNNRQFGGERPCLLSCLLQDKMLCCSGATGIFRIGGRNWRKGITLLCQKVDWCFAWTREASQMTVFYSFGNGDSHLRTAWHLLELCKTLWQSVSSSCFYRLWASIMYWLFSPLRGDFNDAVDWDDIEFYSCLENNSWTCRSHLLASLTFPQGRRPWAFPLRCVLNCGTPPILSGDP